jgi:class 3 adenylate cyclase
MEQRRLAAIMFTDMVGYSALAQRKVIYSTARKNFSSFA